MQQRVNAENTAELTRFIRSLQPDGVTISVGGEIGEVGKSNSTEEELRAYLDGYLGLLGDGAEPISKVSVQTGTSHGGVVLPDGSVAEVSIDFDTLRRLSTVAREEYGFAGCVQHGASTLPEDAFHHFPENGHGGDPPRDRLPEHHLRRRRPAGRAARRDAGVVQRELR